MKQFITQSAPGEDGRVRLTGKDYHYLVNVRRLKKGGRCPLLLPSGERKWASVESLDGGTLCLVVENAAAPPARAPEAEIEMVLMQALPRGGRMDTITRQATECGIGRIVPFIAERSVPRLQTGSGAPQIERWRRIAREARQQSGSAAATDISAPVTGNAVFEVWEELRRKDRDGTVGIMLDSSPLAQCTLHEYLKEQVTQIALAVGPEGGFSHAETEAFAAHGFKPLSLGGTVLRTETAALYAIAAVRVLLLEKQSWVYAVNG